MRKNTLGSILGLATVLLIVGGMTFGVVKAKGLPSVADEGEVVVEYEEGDSVPVPEGEIVLDEDEILEVSAEYEDILNDEEEMEYRTEIAKEIAEQLPKEEDFVNPNFAINGERIKTMDDFTNPADYAKYCEENSNRPIDSDGFFTDVDTYIHFEHPDTYVVEVDGILFDNEGNPLTPEEVATIGMEEENDNAETPIENSDDEDVGE